MKMNRARCWEVSRLPVIAFTGLTILSTWSSHVVGQTAGAAQGRAGGAPRDPARELAMKIDAPFTLAAVGDVFGAMAPIVPLQEPRLQDLLKVIRDADVGFANAESSIADLPRFTGPFGGLLAPKAAAADMSSLTCRG